MSRAVNRDDPYYRSLESQKETLAAFVPELVRKPAKPVDAKTALTLTCRRKRVVDEFGVQQPLEKSTEEIAKAADCSAAEKSASKALLSDVKMPDGYTLLHIAVERSDFELLTKVIDELKISLEVTNNYEQTPFLLATIRGNLPVMKFLLDKGAKLETRDSGQNTPLIVAV